MHRRGRACAAARRARKAEGEDQAHSLRRSARYPLPPLREGAAAGGAGGDVLPDGRLRLDVRAHEGSRQALLHAALRVPEAALQACRDRLHPPHRPRRGGGRADLLLRSGLGRHAGLQRAPRHARDRARALQSGGLEHLRRASLRRRQFLFRRRAHGHAADRQDPAGLPVLCLSRGRESGGSAFDLSDSSLWTLYDRLRNSGAPLSMRKVSERSEIFPVFHDLFQRRETSQEKAAP